MRHFKTLATPCGQAKTSHSLILRAPLELKVLRLAFIQFRRNLDTLYLQLTRFLGDQMTVAP